MRIKRALITGVTGQDGSYLAEFLLKKGYEVYGLVRRLSRPNYTNIEHILPDLKIVDGDLTDMTSLSSAVKTADPDEVYNLGGQTFVQTSFKQPLLTADIDGLGVIRMLEAVRNHSPDIKFYQASTSELYGKVHETPQTEKTPFYPRSPYGFSKLLGFWATVNYRESYNIFACNGILFNHESPRRGHEFVSRKISYGVAKLHLGLADKISLGNLDAKRDWGYAPEYIEGMWRILQAKEPEDYVLATGETHSVNEFVELAFKHIGIDNREKYVKVEPQHIRPAEVNELCGNPAKAKAKLSWEAKTKFSDLVKIMVDSDIELLQSKNN